MRSIIAIVVALLFASFTAAQAPNATFPPAIVNQIISNTTLTTRNSWCTGQNTVCGELCGGTTDLNTCDGPTLQYNCTCSSNHSSPALQFYQNTIPFYECTTAKGYCFAVNANDLAAQQQCNATYICGNTSSSAAPATTSSAPASTSATATGTSTSPTATTTKASAAIRIGQTYGVSVLIAVVLSAMAFYL